MKKIVYYVASSVDGYIAGLHEDVSQYVYEGNGVAQYLADLQDFQTVLMGRNTYEFGYRFGAVAGQPSPAYAHMQHYVFSSQLAFDSQSEQVAVKKMDMEVIQQIRETSPTDIYLCGGGKLAGWLLENKQIDILKVKMSPLIMGNGTKLFEHLSGSYQLALMESRVYEHGLQMMSYQFTYQT